MGHYASEMDDPVPRSYGIRKDPVGWQPIETAPKDGTPMLFTWYGGPDQDVLPVTSGFWSRISEHWYSEISSARCKPTHWMPLPAPPKLDAQ